MKGIGPASPMHRAEHRAQRLDRRPGQHRRGPALAGGSPLEAVGVEAVEGARAGAEEAPARDLLAAGHAFEQEADRRKLGEPAVDRQRGDAVGEEFAHVHDRAPRSPAGAFMGRLLGDGKAACGRCSPGSTPQSSSKDQKMVNEIRSFADQSSSRSPASAAITVSTASSPTFWAIRGRPGGEQARGVARGRGRRRGGTGEDFE